MKVAKFTKEEIADLLLCRYLQRHLPGDSIEMSRWRHSTSSTTKDTLLVKNEDGVKVPVRKILTQVGLGTIFSDIVQDNPRIRNKVGRVGR